MKPSIGDVKEAIKRFSCCDWVDPQNRKACDILLSLASAYVSGELYATEEEMIKIIDNTGYESEPIAKALVGKVARPVERKGKNEV
jgi:hypothetical protein